MPDRALAREQQGYGLARGGAGPARTGDPMGQTAQSASAAQSARNLSERIDRMFGRDKIFAWCFVIALFAVVAYVLLSVNALIPSQGIRIVSWIAAITLVVFNTASIGAMIRHYSHDKEHIYGTDIKHLDAGR